MTRFRFETVATAFRASHRHSRERYARAIQAYYAARVRARAAVIESELRRRLAAGDPDWWK
jgi:hypothetical protein